MIGYLNTPHKLLNPYLFKTNFLQHLLNKLLRKLIISFLNTNLDYHLTHCSHLLLLHRVQNFLKNHDIVRNMSPWEKLLCSGPINSQIIPLILFMITFVITIYVTLQRLIGRNCVSLSGCLTLELRVTIVSESC